MTKFLWAVGFIFVAAFLSVQPSAAYQVTPLVMNMELGQGKTSKRMRVINSDAYDKAIVVTAHEMTLSPDGRRQFSEVESTDILVFPPQALVRANTEQTFQLQWVGSPNPPESKTYSINFSQISVRDRENTGGAALEVMVNVLTTLSVQPPGASFAVLQDSVTAVGQPVNDPQGRRAISLTVTNSSRYHAYISDADITFSAGGWSERIDANNVLLGIGEGLVLPNSTRTFTVPVTPPPGAQMINARFSFADRGFRGRE